MTEDDNNLILAILGGLGVLAAAFLGMQKPASASQGSFTPAPPKMKTGCGCGK